LSTGDWNFNRGAKTEPYRYSKYLELAGRADESMALARRLPAEGAPAERAWAWAQISNLLIFSDMAAAYEAGMRAIALDPTLALCYLNASNASMFTGNDQSGHDLLKHCVELARKGGGALSPIGIVTYRSNLGRVLTMEDDYAGAAKTFAVKENLYPQLAAIRPTQQAAALAYAHDLAASRDVPNQQSDAEQARVSHLAAIDLPAQYERARAIDDWPGAVAVARAELDPLAGQS
jgi:hypothetical protein